MIVPSFSYDYECAPPPGTNLERNGMLPPSPGAPVKHAIFRQQDNDVSAEMGQLPATLLARQNRERGQHPLNAFAAVGPLAKELISGQTATDVYAPLSALVEMSGKVLLAGTDLTAMTLVHYAEMLAGRRLFIRWARDGNGQVVPTRVGSCSAGFGALNKVVEACSQEVDVHGARWTLLDAKSATLTLADAIRREPRLTHCGREHCLRCRDALQGGPGAMA